MMESEKVRQLKKVLLLTSLDLRITEADHEAIGIKLNQGKTWACPKDERATVIKAQMLLVGKAAFIPAEHPSGSVFVWKPNSELLQKDWGDEEKSVGSQGKRGTCNLSTQMCRTKLWAPETIMIKIVLEILPYLILMMLLIYFDFFWFFSLN